MNRAEQWATRFANAIEAHLSAYSADDEKSESDQELADLLEEYDAENKAKPA